MIADGFVYQILCCAALGKPNTTLSKEAMDEKKANLTGEDSQSRSRRNSAALASHVNNVTANGN